MDNDFKYNNLAHNLKIQRLEAGLTQKELADQLYTTRQEVCNWEHCRRQPSLDMILNIADFFKVDIDALFKEIDEPVARDVN